MNRTIKYRQKKLRNISAREAAKILQQKQNRSGQLTSKEISNVVKASAKAELNVAARKTSSKMCFSTKPEYGEKNTGKLKKARSAAH